MRANLLLPYVLQPTLNQVFPGNDSGHEMVGIYDHQVPQSQSSKKTAENDGWQYVRMIEKYGR